MSSAITDLEGTSPCPIFRIWAVRSLGKGQIGSRVRASLNDRMAALVPMGLAATLDP